MSLPRKFWLSQFNAVFSVGVLSIAIGLALLAAPSATFAQTGCVTASGGHGWSHMTFDAQSSQFTAEYDATPSARPTSSIVALSDDTQNAFTGFGTLVRFNNHGNIDARNGGAYDAASVIPYHARLTYHFQLNIDVVAHTYSISVKQGTGPVQIVGMNFAFRTQQNGVFNLDSMGVNVDEPTGTLRACNLTITPLAPEIDNPNCTIVIPPNPLTAQGLATPYELMATNPDDGPCTAGNPNNSAFVQAAIIDTDTGQLSVYAPLVITAGATPAVPPVVPVLPLHNVVGLWFGFNGNNLLQAAASATTLTNNHCVNGLGASLFTQFSHCNAVNFFAAANAAIAAGKLTPPLPGTGADGFTCPLPRSFTVVDQDQSDNVPATYLLVAATGQTAQNTAANRAALVGAKVFGNPSDERLLAILLDPALGCTPWKVPDMADPGAVVASLAANELQSRMFSGQDGNPIALMPLNDPMTEVDGAPSLAKTNLYRAGVDQTQAATNADADGTTYCRNFRHIHPTRLAIDKPFLVVRPSPFPNLANSLFTFMVQRATASYVLLNCEQLLGQPDRITAITDANGVTIDATIAPDTP